MTTAAAALLRFEDLPFCIGAQHAPHNPAGIPDTFPFELTLDEELGLLQQRPTAGLAAMLSEAYTLGIEIGTPIDDSPLGLPYANDFLDFLGQHATVGGRALEIGAGVGYLSAQLARRGWQVDAVEPGAGYQQRNAAYGVRVLRDRFPTSALTGPYDLIMFCAVLEHIADMRLFLDAVRNHLAPHGVAVLSVPDCGAEIGAGDPTMLLHEHYHYFTRRSLQRCLAAAGLDATITASRYGRSLFAAAQPGKADAGAVTAEELTSLREYGARGRAVHEVVRERIRSAAREQSVGIYCPARGLALLPAGVNLRFFDDDAALQGKYYPPFPAVVERPERLTVDPPACIWIMSRTFGDRIAERLGRTVSRDVQVVTLGSISAPA